MKKKTPDQHNTARIDPARISADLLAWYDVHRRHLPWRAAPGETPDPYRVWLSEIMLQQTTVVTVEPYFSAFTKRWPTVHDLAAADQDEILQAWSGLGYYARARNLHRCAREIVARFGGVLPDDEETLKTLPGIGDYTAAAIAAIAFGHKATVVDGNVERVTARLFAIDQPLPGAKPWIRAMAATLTPDRHAGDFAQAMMDLGAGVCVPRNPQCGRCPLSGQCGAQAAGLAGELPRRTPRKAPPQRYGIAFWLQSPDGRVLLRRRPENGLLGGMMEIPSTPWAEGDGGSLGMEDLVRLAPLDVPWRVLPGRVRHVFTHFSLELEIWAATAGQGQLDQVWGIWWPVSDLDRAALPSVMKKICTHARTHDSEGENDAGPLFA